MELNNVNDDKLNIFFKDPDEISLKGILDDLKNSKTTDEIQSTIEKSLPGWLIYSLDKYSDDYIHLQLNWENICEKLNTNPKKIIIVEDIYFDRDHLLINIFCERMTREGYVVRRKCELQKCTICNSAIPTFLLYENMKYNKIIVPIKWTRKCSKC